MSANSTARSVASRSVLGPRCWAGIELKVATAVNAYAKREDLRIFGEVEEELVILPLIRTQAVVQCVVGGEGAAFSSDANTVNRRSFKGVSSLT